MLGPASCLFFGRVMGSWKIVVGLGAEIPFGSVRGLRISDIHPAGVITSEYVEKTSVGPTSTTLLLGPPGMPASVACAEEGRIVSLTDTESRRFRHLLARSCFLSVVFPVPLEPETRSQSHPSLSVEEIRVL